MSIPKSLQGAMGGWKGRYKLWFMPTDPAIECETAAMVEGAIGDQFLSVRYQWEYKGKPQVGGVVLGDDPESKSCAGFFADTFHYSHRMMPCRGGIVDVGAVKILGHYPAPSGPDWGWRTELELVDADTFVMRAYNIKPDGAEGRAVEATYRRQR